MTTPTLSIHASPTQEDNQFKHSPDGVYKATNVNNSWCLSVNQFIISKEPVAYR